MAQADAEDGDAGVGDFAQLGDDGGVFCRVAGAVAEHDAIGRVGEDFLGGGAAGHADDFAAAADQLAGDVFLGAEIPQHHGALAFVHGLIGFEMAHSVHGARIT